MRNANLVFLTADTDCDGTTIGAHRVPVPAHRVGELSDGDALGEFLLAQDHPFAGYARDGGLCEIMTLGEFLRQYADVFRNAEHRELFCGAWDAMGGQWVDGRGWTGSPGHPYVTVSQRWNPWVFDDTIGIPALDSRYDDAHEYPDALAWH